MYASRNIYPRAIFLCTSFRLTTFLLGLLLSMFVHAAPPSFSSSFSPTTIASGNISTLTYTIDNTSQSIPVSGLTFSNTLPAGMTVAGVSRASTTCLNGVFTAVPGATSVTFTDYRLSGGASCTFTFDVVSTTAGTHTNTSGALASSEGSAGTASANLTVDSNRPSLRMAFSPSTMSAGGVSRLTYTLDNTLNGGNATFLTFSNTFPDGLVIADQPNLENTCIAAIGTLSVSAGAESLSFPSSTFVSVNAGTTCTVSVNVTAASVGEYVNVANDLSSAVSPNPSGPSTALLTVSNAFLSAAFPTTAAPGTSIALRYTLNNTDRVNAATDITFTNDLNAALSGLTATALPADGFCGDGSTISGTSTLSISGASLATEASCSFEVTVLVPANAASGNYTNTTSIINLTQGSATTRPAFSHVLNVTSAPQLSMTFVDDTVSTGDTATLRYTVTNVSTSSTVTDIAFTQELNNAYAGITVDTLPSANSCGTGSTFTSSVDSSEVLTFQVGGANLVAGASCTFDLIVRLPSSGFTDSVTFTSGAITGTLSGSMVSGNRASAALNIIAAPRLTLDINEDYAVPGSTVTAELSLAYDGNAGADATGLAFSIDLNAALSGLVSTSGTMNDVCGSGSVVSGTSTLSLSGGSLSAGETCSFTVTLQIPGGASLGAITVSSSTIMGTVASEAVSSGSTSDTLTLTGLSFSKTFVTNPVLPGENTVLRYTISNDVLAQAATSIAFSDDFNSTLSSLMVSGLPANPCGAGSSISGLSSLSVADVSLAPGESCTFDVDLLVPGGAAQGSYISVTSNLTATVNSGATTNQAATAVLNVDTLGTVISASASNPTFVSPIPVNIIFSRSVVNLVLGDLVITNGVASNLSGSGSSYTVDITPSATGDVVINLPANSVNDASNSSVQNTNTSFTIEFSDAPANVAVTVPAMALNALGVNYTIEGTHTINASRVFLFADINNDNVADNTTVLASDTVENNRWSLNATLAPQVDNNFVVVWEDRINNVNRTVDVPTITEITPNFPPTISGTPPTSVDEDANYSFTPSFMDANTNDTQTFSITNQPSWVSFSTTTGALTGTPTNSDVGTTSNIVITLTDSANATDSLTAFSITVNNTNDAPVISGTPTTSVAEDSAYSFTPSVSDVDVGDTRSFSITNQPSWASFSTSTGALTGTPTNSNIGTTSNIVITVTDSANASDSLSAFAITVTNTNDAPVISGTPATSVNEDASYSFTPSVTDVDPGDTATFSITNMPSWASFNTATGALTGTPTNSDVGTTSNIVISVADSSASTDALTAFNITVVNTNDAPVISGSPSTSVAQDAAYSFTPTASDVDVGDSLTFSITNMPSWASFDTATGALTGTPGNADVGTTTNIVISVSDDANATASLAAFSLTVSNVNDAPVLSGAPATFVAEDTAYSFTPSLSDVDSTDTAVFSINTMPTWASFDTSTGALTGTPTNADVGTTSNIIITVTDSANATDTIGPFSITVGNINDAPVISGSPATTVDEDASYSFVPSSSDVDSGDTVSFSINNAPSWASFDTATGALTGTPTNADVGTTSNIVITITDSASATASLPPFNITVNNTNDAPTISGTPNSTVAQGGLYSFTPVANDVDVGDSVTFSINNAPSWASFSSSTGTLTGTPGNGDVGTTSNIVITVSDAASSSASLAAFSINVTNTNDTPTISGAPSTSVAEDANYSFIPTANDIDLGDTLTFSISNMPSWASFNTSTGALTGIPTNADVGLSSNIVIAVSDGAGASASLAAFSIVVNNVNDAPQISGTPATSANEDAVYTFTPTVTDDDSGDTRTFTITNLPQWATFASDTGVLTGTPRNSDVGVSQAIVIAVSDSAGASASLTAFTITVVNTNDAPVITGTPVTSVNEEVSYSFTPSASDEDDGDNLRFTIVNQPSWAEFNTADGTLSGTPAASDIAVYAGIVISVVDDSNASASLATFSITVNNVNEAPTISGSPATSVQEDTLYSFIPTVTDSDAIDVQVFSIVNRPEWATFNVSNGQLSGTPENDDVGTTENIVITVTDSGNASVSLPPFSITVSNVNDAPVISGSPIINTPENTFYSFTPTVTDSDALDTQVFSIVNRPEWATFNTANGELSGTPDDDDVGTTENIVITVTDSGNASTSLPPFSITVENLNRAPIAVDDTFTLDFNAQGYLLDVLLNDTDEDGDELTILSSKTELGSVTIEEEQLRFVSDVLVERVELEYLISDGDGGQDRAQVTLIINSDDNVQGPEITVPDDIEVNATGIFTRVNLGVATAVDSEGNPLAVSLLENNQQFTSGDHRVFWQATDSNGQTAVREQHVRVNPLVSFTLGQQVVEDSTVTVGIVLSGEPPEFPVVVAYEVSGTADEGDHNLQAGELSLTAINNEISFDVFADGVAEETETIILTLSGSENQGNPSTHTIEIVDTNIAPRITLQVVQDGELRSLVDSNGGPVVVTVEVNDINRSDSHTFLWEASDEVAISDTDNVENTFTLDPSLLLPDQYALSVTVTDSGIPARSTVNTVYFNVTESLPELTDADTDGDLIPDDIEGVSDNDSNGIANFLDAITQQNVLPSDIQVQDEFLIEGPVGADLMRGRFSSRTDFSAGVLSEMDAANELSEDTEARRVGATFDLIISGLPEAGQSYSVALPQLQAAPSGAMYRQFSSTQWAGFVTDERNGIFSAPGERGFCPQPQASVWQEGITEGHWCIQLLIEDGGPNDSDGIANGVIVFTGNTAVALSDNSFPIVADDNASTTVAIPIDVDVLSNDIDEDNDSLSISTVTAAIGTVEVSDNGELRYTPVDGFIGIDTITYSISDGNGGTASGTLTVNVGEIPQRSGGGGGGAMGWMTLCLMLLLSVLKFWVALLRRRHLSTGFC